MTPQCRRRAAAITLALAVVPLTATSGSAQERVPAAVTSLTGGTVEFEVRFVRDSIRWSADSLLCHHVRIYRSVQGRARMRAEHSGRNPLGDVAPPIIEAAKLAELKRIMRSEEFDYGRALELCGADRACARVLDDLLRERLDRETGVSPAAAPGGSTGYIVFRPDGAAACEELQTQISDAHEERLLPRPGGGLFHGSTEMAAVSASAQATPEEDPALAPLCDALVVFDLAPRVYHVDFPARAQATIAGEALHRSVTGGGGINPRGVDDAWPLSEADASRPLRIENLQTPRWFSEESWLPEWIRSEIYTTTDLPAFYSVTWGDREETMVPVTARIFITIRPAGEPEEEPEP